MAKHNFNRDDPIKLDNNFQAEYQENPNSEFGECCWMVFIGGHGFAIADNLDVPPNRDHVEFALNKMKRLYESGQMPTTFEGKEAKIYEFIEQAQRRKMLPPPIKPSSNIPGRMAGATKRRVIHDGPEKGARRPTEEQSGQRGLFGPNP